MNENENITPVVEDDDVLLPDGWQEGDDIFAEDEWSGTAGDARQTAQTSEETTGGQEGAPTTEQPAPGDQTPADPAPTPEQPAAPVSNKLKFKARVDRQDLDVEVDESELPALYQKAQVTDRVQARLARQAPAMEQLESMAKSMGHSDPVAFLNAMKDNYQRSEIRRLVGDGVHEEVAKDMVERRFVPQQQAPATEPESVPAKSPTRDFDTEIAQLKAVYPDVLKNPIPKQVLGAAMDENHPKHLVAAYAEYMVGQHKAEAEKLRRENEVLKQNAAAAARAPVSGVTGGGPADEDPEDDFLKGFNSY